VVLLFAGDSVCDPCGETGVTSFSKQVVVAGSGGSGRGRVRAQPVQNHDLVSSF